jgi:phosphatidylserine/phosphatidylglycerophosphate/cardiolipin synthase-like enzyme/outer membrane protein OmpA-like peptidoglycan-associated protein
MQGQFIGVDEAAGLLADCSGDRSAFGAHVGAMDDDAGDRGIALDAELELDDAFQQDPSVAFSQTEEHRSGDTLDDVFVEALNADDAGDFFTRVLRGVRLAAGQSDRPYAPVELLRRFAGLLKHYRARQFDEMEAAEDLADRFVDEGTDEAAALVGGLLARTLARPSGMTRSRPLPGPLRRQLVRSTRQAAQTLVRRQGPTAIRAMPTVARSIQRTTVRRGLPAQALPSAIRSLGSRIVQAPELIPALTGLRPSAGKLQLSATPRVLTYTTRDVIDPRINVSAQHALVRLSRNPLTSADAVSMLQEIKADRLIGIYKADEGMPIRIARQMGRNLGWGSLIPRGAGSALILDPSDLFHGPPMIVFHPSLAPAVKARELDQTLMTSWNAYLAFRRFDADGVASCKNLETPEILDRFEFDKDTVQPFHLLQVARIARCVVARAASAQAIRSVRIVGHADPVGTESYNVQLGLRRARQVERRLRQAIISLSGDLSSGMTFDITSLGETKPTGKGADRDRRVEVYLVSSSKVPPVRRIPPTNKIPPARRTPPAKRTPPKGNVSALCGPNRWQIILGKNYCRPGNRVAFLVDGPAAFEAMALAIRTAKRPGHYIYLLGWWLDDGFNLSQHHTPSTLRYLFSRAGKRGVQVRMMLWDQESILSAKNTAEVEFVNQHVLGGAAILDGHQLSPIWGSQHQKILVVKGEKGLVAFCGGIDINKDRLPPVHRLGVVVGSTSSTSGKNTYLHDVHCQIAGPAAHDLLQTFVQRWYSNPEHREWDRARGALLGLQEPVPFANKGHQFVRIGRTFNGTSERPDGSKIRVQERTVQDMLLAAISGAQKFIYIEDQYLFNMCAADALNHALWRVEHITILIPHASITDAPRRWEARMRFIQRLTKGPNGGKVRIFYLIDPITRRVGGPHTYVHSKIFIIDDELVVIGSANINRRGWEHDTEVAAAIFDSPGESRRGIVPVAKELRMRLWAEHLNVPREAVLDPLASARLWLPETTIAGKRVALYDPYEDRDAASCAIPWDIIDPSASSEHASCCISSPHSCDRCDVSCSDDGLGC